MTRFADGWRMQTFFFTASFITIGGFAQRLFIPFVWLSVCPGPQPATINPQLNSALGLGDAAATSPRPCTGRKLLISLYCMTHYLFRLDASSYLVGTAFVTYMPAIHEARRETRGSHGEASESTTLAYNIYRSRFLSYISLPPMNSQLYV
jgi:hypothetical protein